MDFRESLPSSFRHRFDSLGGYINAILEQKRKGEPKLTKREIEFIQIVVFITVLKRFLVEGAKAAQMTLDELKEQGIKSFSIGSSHFEEGSEDLRRGFVLASELLNAISNPRIKEWVESDKPLYQIVDDLDRNARLP